MTDRTPTEAAQGQLEAYNAHDLEAFLSHYTDDCVIRSMPGGNLMMDGKEAMRERYGALFAQRPELRVTLRARMEHGPFVIDHEEVVGLRDDETVYAVALYEVRDGMIRAVWFLREDD